MIDRNILVIFYCIVVIALSVLFYYVWKFYYLRKEEHEETRSLESGIIHSSSQKTPSSVRENESLLQANEENVPIGLETEPINAIIKNLKFDERFEIDVNKFSFYNLSFLGNGYYGKVFKERMHKKQKNGLDSENSLEVAVKRALRPEDPSEQQLMCEELNVMCVVGKHPNILALIRWIRTNEILIVSEFVEKGDLVEYLRARRRYFNKDIVCVEDNGRLLCPTDLLSFAFQIANGMKFLGNVACVHRDLALRNVFVKRNRIIRIADFGLARWHENKEYYRKKTDVGFPMKWLAPECFEFEQERENIKFDSKSDIWSYGVCLYEIFSLGVSPYEGLDFRPDYFQGLMKYVRDGNQLPSPEHGSDKIYEFMQSCWNLNPDKRPVFSECRDFFQKLLQQVSKPFFENLLKEIQNEEKLQTSYDN
ncbi:receptor protein-tyrosine kinase [Caenorhabditis elegans]|uniref:receptor protein-tyrosine kinase n=1 Tax=Caenorhabditis elegans TaxID=6239 RepID=Q9N4T2_CAEEL|nr:Protein kinase domain-containing protein [Caenorhabditis elegans]CCD72852.1 Protein kinase domain-containing protein [Caenorhabditis elegans]|eukprot:NP_503375.2 Uncharacterized protein CELE_Y50D4B.6 [Caenorhabditis elegans]